MQQMFFSTSCRIRSFHETIGEDEFIFRPEKYIFIE